jgi:hypothetical protein
MICQPDSFSDFEDAPRSAVLQRLRVQLLEHCGYQQPEQHQRVRADVLGHKCDQAEQPDPPVCTHQPVLCFHDGLPEFDQPDCSAPAAYLIDGGAEFDCLHACQEHIAEELGLLNWVPQLCIWTVSLV